MYWNHYIKFWIWKFNVFICCFGEVTEESTLIPSQKAFATINVIVKEIPEEAIDKSGSIRFYGITAEEFVSPSRNHASSISK